MKKITIFIIIGFCILFLAAYIITQEYKGSQQEVEYPDKKCKIDSDCVVFGETGDCNCGCYNKNNIPTETGGKCFCQAPISCKCVAGKCEGIF